MNNLGILLLDYWKGNLTLKKAFLYVFLPLSVAWYSTKIIMQDLMGTEPMSITASSIWLVLLSGIVIGMYRFIGLWRCSKNTDSKVLNIAAKALAIYMISPALIAVSVAIYARVSL